MARSRRRTSAPPRAGWLLTALIALALGGCGGEEVSVADSAVEAREENQVELGGVLYRVVLFREMNPYTAPDDGLWTGDPPPQGTGLYLVSLTACGIGDGPSPATDEISLDDAFGQRFEPRRSNTADVYAYEPRELGPGRCLPLDDSAADATFGGAVLVFEVPFESTAERPMVLELGDPDGEAAVRVELDL